MLLENTRSPAAARAETIVSPAYAEYGRPFQLKVSSLARSITSPG
jgi:hypothetical protein